MPARNFIRFLLDGEPVEVTGISPTTTVLRYLRETLGRMGTKEGCAEGDCGACTVVLGEPDGAGGIRLRPVNSCIRFLPTLDGKALFTVESLRRADGRLHPVQQAMVRCHGSQCGFCTPGFVMSLFALFKGAPAPDREAIDVALSGNLCRCTGYRPIIDAAAAMHALADPADADWLARPCQVGEAAAEEVGLAAQLARMVPAEPVALKHGRQRYFAPVCAEGLQAVLRRYPDARLLAGGTDVGLWVTKQHQDLEVLVHTGRVAELARIDVAADSITIGAAVPLEDAFAYLCARIPALRELHLRFASPPIRHSGTLGGNIANGSPIGDSMPGLIALGAQLRLIGPDGVRELPLEDFYVGYRHTDRQPGEYLDSVVVPVPGAGSRFATYKVSRRLDQDISAVCGAFHLVLDGERIDRARVAFGGMAATPKRAPACEAALAGRAWHESTAELAAAALTLDFQPLTDMRAGSDYRARVASNLVRRFFLETVRPAVPTRVVDYAG